jgi:NitT/TauT family transport system substrate-binding protein
MRTSALACAAVLSAGIICGGSAAQAVELNVTQFGVGMYGVPYAVAVEKGYFRDIGLDVTGFLTSAGGGTTIRNVLASELPYGEVSLPAALVALKQGLKLTIIHGGVARGTDQLWVVRKDDDSIKKPEDLKGKKIGFSGPNGVTDILSSIMLDRYGLKDSVQRRAVGAVGAGLTALREGAIDATYMFQPAWSREQDKYRLAFSSGVFAPRVMQTVGIVRSDYLKEKPELFRGIIAARRKGVEFIKKNPDEAVEIMAKYYKMDIGQATQALKFILSEDQNYWSTGEFDYEGMDVLVKGLQLIGVLQPGPYDWSKVIDESYLPKDLGQVKN